MSGAEIFHLKKKTKVEELKQEGVESICEREWSACCKHVMDVEQELRDSENEAVWTWNEKAERKFLKKSILTSFLKVLNILICIKYCT